MALRVKKNDTVLVRSGKDRGKKGKVLEIFPDERMLVVEGVNKIYRHVKSQQRGEKGQRIEVNGPIYIDNVMVICNSCKKPSRMGFKIETVGNKKQKVRVCKKCSKTLTKDETKKKTK